jgi:signal transduction histidine kinase
MLAFQGKLMGPLRTISGRIVLGFMVLLVVFGGVAGYAITEMNRLGRDVRYIRAAYLEISPPVAELAIQQETVVDALGTDRPSRPIMAKYRAVRLKKLQEIEDKLAAVTDVPRVYAKQVEGMRERIGSLRNEINATALLAEAALVPDRTTEEAKTALARLTNNESKLQKTLRDWQKQLQNSALAIIKQVTRRENQARVLGMTLGGLAAGIAVLVAIWAVLTLRPLGRLRAGARRVARGDYRGRVEAGGHGTEVAELANEFNAMAAAIEEREQDLVRSERLAAVGKMAAVITHEVRNPLSSIGLNAELLEDEIEAMAAGKSPDEAKALLAAMQKEVDRLTAITEEYLRFARLPRPRLEREQLNPIVSGLVEFQREELGLRGVKVEARLGADVPPVAADEGQLRQALLNLVRNAADAMAGSGGGALTVSTQRAGGEVEVRVADTGPGISPELLPRIFEPFFSTKEGGTGLGLALTQQIIAEHGGSIEVESEHGKGTTFVVKLPAAA